jgi:hypothetical protein
VRPDSARKVDSHVRVGPSSCALFARVETGHGAHAVNQSVRAPASALPTRVRILCLRGLKGRGEVIREKRYNVSVVEHCLSATVYRVR